jgi:type I restriction enzyme M protein
MEDWANIMQDDCYLIAGAGRRPAAQPREIRQVKNKENKLVWLNRTITREASAVSNPI